VSAVTLHHVAGAMLALLTDLPDVMADLGRLGIDARVVWLRGPGLRCPGAGRAWVGEPGEAGHVAGEQATTTGAGLSRRDIQDSANSASRPFTSMEENRAQLARE
jgi:hypothetical protein